MNADLFVYISSRTRTSILESRLAGIGLNRCRSEEGKLEMMRVLRASDVPISPSHFPSGSWFIPGSRMFFKPNYRTIDIGTVVLDESGEGRKKVYPTPGIHLSINHSSILVSLGGIYISSMGATGRLTPIGGKTWEEKALKEFRLYQVRVDVPLWDQKERLLDPAEVARAILKEREAAGE